MLVEQHKYDEARSLFTKSLPIQERVLGASAPELALALERFARLLRQMKDTTAAETVEARVRNIRATLAYTVSVDRLGK